jgi:hypothetical protein
VGLAIREDLGDVVDQPLYLVDVPGFLLLHYQDSANDMGGCHDIQEEGLMGSSEARTGGLEMSTLRSSSAFYVSSIQWKESDFFSNLYRGSPRSPSRDMKQLRTTRHPMSH